MVHDLRRRLAALALRLLRIPCGALGATRFDRPWFCGKPFGHRDSCFYGDAVQPLTAERQRRKGWDV
jgi:hypothetical protein